MSGGTVFYIIGGLVAGVSTILYIVLALWVHKYEKRIKEEMKQKYEY